MTMDFGKGIPDGELREGVPLAGEVGGEQVVLVRAGGQVHAVGATCTHYGGPLAEGIVEGCTIRCPWHHGHFDLKTGAPSGPPIAPIACYDVVLENGTIRVGPKREPAVKPVAVPASVVIIGGGAAGVACAETLRLEGHRGAITIIAGEGSDPVDRPNLSKDYLAGTAPEEWVYLRTGDALTANEIAVVREQATAIDGAKKIVRAGRDIAFDALLIATGAEPVRLPLPGADLPHVHVLRTLSHSRSIAAGGGPAVIIGASFIGLEVAASLRARGIDVTVVGPESVPLARVLGDEVGAFVKRVHESKGVSFRLGRKPTAISADAVTLDDGSTLPAKQVVLGVGVKPRLDLAQAAGLPIDRGVLVDEDLRAAPGVWAAGDIARFPLNGERVRVEHWQVAVRHGQAAARAMLGKPRHRDIPFFWSAHHDVTLGYVGHAEKFDKPEVHGSLDARDAHVVYRDAGTIKAVVTLGRDKLGLEVEAAMERGDAAALERLANS
jgi:NADPH-dependent 2,4-dienoyl-CoA reductase/sulfur reductase-like enzyme/nitrite reductase/ring-hydroxylating ferredoxin subunit